MKKLASIRIEVGNLSVKQQLELWEFLRKFAEEKLETNKILHIKTITEVKGEK